MTRVSEVVPGMPGPPAVHRPPASLPLGRDTLHKWQARLFGAPPRATLEIRTDGLVMTCAAGANEAGLLLTADEPFLPAGARLDLHLSYEASVELAVGFSDAQALAREAPEPLARLARVSSVEHAVMALPRSDLPQAQGLTFSCPVVGGSLRILALELRSARRAVNATRATWIWRADDFLNSGSAVLSRLASEGFRTVFVAVPMTGSPAEVEHPAALADFFARAAALGIEVWAVEGDPRAVTDSGRRIFVERTRALARFHAAQPDVSRIQGVQYDIEPYLVPGFELERDAWLRAYLATLRELRAELPVPMEAAVPFWWLDLALDSRWFLEDLAKVVDGLTIMNYRTDADDLQRFAEPYLAWGVREQRHVRIALEFIDLPDQQLWHFRPGQPGRLWHVRLGEADVLLLLDRPRSNADGETYQRSYAHAVAASATTFHAQRERLEEILPDLVSAWSAWDSFSGVALHEYLPAPGAD